MPLPAPDMSLEILPQLRTASNVSAALRAALQVPLHLRFYGMRISTFLASILLTQDPEIRTLSVAGLDAALEGYAQLARIMETTAGATPDGIHPIVAEIFADVMPRHPEAREAIRGYEAIARDHLRTIQSGKMPPPGSFDGMMSFLCVTFHPAVRTLSAGMVEAGASFRAQRDIAAMRARDRAIEARDRIDDISRTVRLISLNARVEAARAGGAGRAFGIIAEEIKALSEQSETASEELGSSVEAMMANIRSF